MLSDARRKGYFDAVSDQLIRAYISILSAHGMMKRLEEDDSEAKNVPQEGPKRGGQRRRRPRQVHTEDQASEVPAPVAPNAQSPAPEEAGAQLALGDDDGIPF